MLKIIYKLFALILVAFAGGFFAVIFINWLYKPVKVEQFADAVSIANTYIVFTTIIFVGFTVVLGIAGYVFTQQFSASKEDNENRLLNEIRDKLKDNDDLCVKLMKIIIENPQVKSQITETLETKATQLITDKLSEYELNGVGGFQSLSDDLVDGSDANGQ